MVTIKGYETINWQNDLQAMFGLFLKHKLSLVKDN